MGITARYSKSSSTLRFQSCKWGWSAAIAFATLIGRYPAVQAADFNFTYAPGASFEQILSFEIAGLFWSDYLADDATINLFVETTDMLPENVIGGALPGIQANQKYRKFRKSVRADRTSADDKRAFKHLQDDEEYFIAYIDGFKVDNNSRLNMTNANAKALGMLDGSEEGLDGYILMSNLTDMNTSWSYDLLGNNVSEGSLDFLSVAIHEIGHTLGFVSGVDAPGWLSQKTQYDADSIDDYFSSLIGNVNNATPLDMFRISDHSLEEGGSDEPWIDLSIGSDPFFSIDRGQSVLADFATGENTSFGGDGNQASHWEQQADSLGIMDPILNPGERREITALDKTAMDVIGWDLQTGGSDLATLHGVAMDRLAQEIGVTAGWIEANPHQAALLFTPDWLDADNNNLDDRGELLNDMVISSEVYEWGWSGYWWGWSGYWWGWSGYWQEHGDLDDLDDLDDLGFWQNFSWQTLDTPTVDAPINQSQTTAASVPEPNSILGLLGLGWLGLGSLYRRQGDRRPRAWG